jgi:hypothetical protein
LPGKGNGDYPAGPARDAGHNRASILDARGTACARVEVDDAYVVASAPAASQAGALRTSCRSRLQRKPPRAGQPTCLSLQPFAKQAVETFIARSLLLPLTLVCHGPSGPTKSLTHYGSTSQ